MTYIARLIGGPADGVDHECEMLPLDLHFPVPGRIVTLASRGTNRPELAMMTAVYQRRDAIYRVWFSEPDRSVISREIIGAEYEYVGTRY